MQGELISSPHETLLRATIVLEEFCKVTLLLFLFFACVLCVVVKCVFDACACLGVLYIGVTVCVFYVFIVCMPHMYSWGLHPSTVSPHPTSTLGLQ